ncbi:MAG: hypothetical protein ABW076_11980 [Candidatus Thiodiazotropha sp.]
MFQTSAYRCHVRSSQGFCLGTALLTAALVALFLLPDPHTLASPHRDGSGLRISGFLLLFGLTYLMTRFGYGYRLRIDGDDPDSANLWVRSPSKASPTTIPLPAIDRVEAVAYRDRPKDLYAVPQYAHTGEGVIVYYTLGARYGDSVEDQRRIWFPVCNRERLIERLSPVLRDH